MGNRKVLLIIVIGVIVLALGAVVATFLGVDLFATVSGEAGKQPDSFSSVDDLKSGKAYVWHHDGGDIKEDLKKDAGESVYFTSQVITTSRTKNLEKRLNIQDPYG